MRKQNIAAAVMLVAFACLFFYRCTGGGKLFFSADNYFLYHPHQLFFVESLKNGIFPFWNPHIACGVPFFADITHGVLYPLHYLSLAVPVPRAMTAVIIAEVFLAALFLYLFLRETGRSFWASIIGGISFAFSAPLLLLTHHITMLGAICWIGAVFYCFEKSIREEKLTWAAIGGFCLALSVFAGGIHAGYMILFALFFYFVFRFVIDLGSRRLKAFKRVLLPFCIIVLFASGLTAVQAVPAYELYGHCAGGHDMHQFIGSGEMPPSALVNLFFPKIWGSIGEGAVWDARAAFAGYFGMAGILFAMLCVLRMKEKSRWFFFILAVISLVIALGSQGRLFYALYYFLPGFRIFRNPSVYLVLFAFSGSICAAFGFECVLTAQGETRKESRFFFIFLLVVSIIMLTSLLALWYFDFGASRRWLVLLSAMVRGEELNPERARLIYGIIFSSLFHGFCAAALVSFFSILYCFRLLRKAVFIFFILVALCADLFLIGTGFMMTADEKVISGKLDFISKIPEKTDYRIASFSQGKPADFWMTSGTNSILEESGLSDNERKWKAFRQRLETLPDNEVMKYGLRTAGGYNTFNLKRYVQFMELASGRAVLNPARISSDIPDVRFRDYLNIKYVITDTQSKDESLRMVVSTPTSFLYENPRAFPRAFFVDEIIAVAGAEEAFNVLRQKDMDFSRQAVVESPGRTFSGTAGKRPIIKLADISPNELSFEIGGVEEECFCVLTDSYFPGWRAFADGKEIPIYRANGAFRGLFIPRGCRSLTMTFRPSNFYAALAVSLSFFAAFLFIMVWSFIRSRRPVTHS